MFPSKSGKPYYLKIANAITLKYPEIEVIVLLIDERPEEVTDMQRSIKGDVIYSTLMSFLNIILSAENVLDRAQRWWSIKKMVILWTVLHAWHEHTNSANGQNSFGRVGSWSSS